MTITAPLTTGADLAVEDELVVIPDEPTIIADPVPTAAAAETSLWRDPMLPFLVLGTLTLVAMLLAAFLLSA